MIESIYLKNILSFEVIKTDALEIKQMWTN